MPEKKTTLTAAQRKAAVFVMRHISFAPKSAEILVAEKKKAEAEAAQAIARILATARVGETMPDGSVYLGTHRRREWFTMAEDAKGADGKSLTMDFNAAAAYAQNLRAHGHDDWEVPDLGILQDMYCNRSSGSFKGTYDGSGLTRASGMYWSSTVDPNFPGCASARTFDDYYGSCFSRMSTISTFSVRCVRSTPGK